jgi:hypothetical protein
MSPVIIAFNLDGSPAWTQTTTGFSAWQVSPFQAGEYLYIAAGDILEVLRSSNGKKLSRSISTGMTGTPVVDGNSVFVPSYSGVICTTEFTAAQNWPDYR